MRLRNDNFSTTPEEAEHFERTRLTRDRTRPPRGRDSNGSSDDNWVFNKETGRWKLLPREQPAE